VEGFFSLAKPNQFVVGQRDAFVPYLFEGEMITCWDVDFEHTKEDCWAVGTLCGLLGQAWTRLLPHYII